MGVSGSDNKCNWLISELGADAAINYKSEDLNERLAELFPDGSLIFTLQEAGGGIVKVDACSNEVWNLPGEYHHTVSRDNDGNYWSFEGSQYTLDQDLVKISAETGEILKRIDMTEVRKVNKYAHISQHAVVSRIL